MQTDPVIVEIITAANLAGIEQARVGLLGFNASTLGLAAGLGILAAGTKSAVDIAEQHATVLGRLKQASEVTGYSFDFTNKVVSEYIKQNQQFIPDNNKAVDTFAMLLRSTGDYNMALQGLRVVMNLTAITGKDWDTATQAVNLGLQGTGRGLRELGIDVAALKKDQDNLTVATKDLTKAKAEVEKATKEHDSAERRLEEYMVQIGRPGHRATTEELMRLQDARNRVLDTTLKLKTAEDNLSTAQSQVNNSSKIQQDVLNELNKKTLDGANQTSDFQRQVNTLNGNWQTMANTWGVAVVYGLTLLTGALNAVYGALDAIGKNNDFWGKVSRSLTDLANDLNRTVRSTGVGPPNTPAPPPSSGSRVQFDPTTQTWTWAPGPNGTIASHGPGEYVDPATGKIYGVGNPQEQSGTPRPTPPDPGLSGFALAQASQQYAIALRQWEEQQKARQEALANYQAQQATLNQIAQNTKQKPMVNQTFNISGQQDAQGLAMGAARALRTLLQT